MEIVDVGKTLETIPGTNFLTPIALRVRSEIEVARVTEKNIYDILKAGYKAKEIARTSDISYSLCKFFHKLPNVPIAVVFDQHV